MTIAILGATGCVGSGLVWGLLENSEHLLRAGYRSWHPEIVHPRLTWQKIDLLKPESLTEFLSGVDVLYYLIHSLDRPNFRDLDRELAEVTAKAVTRSSVQKIIYLGGLVSPNAKEPSPHLRSRVEVGQILGSAGVDLVELRASIVLADCSDSFKIIRSLTATSPVLFTPKSIRSKCAPLGLDELLTALTACINLPAYGHTILEVGNQVMQYSDLLKMTAEVVNARKLKIISLPWFPLWLAAWVSARVSGVNSREIYNLFSSLRTDSIYSQNYLPELAGDEIRPVSKIIDELKG
jgi:uncharacterized protein YbjT (DUF2867 family)